MTGLFYGHHQFLFHQKPQKNTKKSFRKRNTTSFSKNAFIFCTNHLTSTRDAADIPITVLEKLIFGFYDISRFLDSIEIKMCDKINRNQYNKMPIEEVKQILTLNNFIWTEKSKFESRTERFEVMCGRCEMNCLISISSLLGSKNRKGCEYCYRYNRTYDWNYIKNIAQENKCTLLSSGKDYRGRDTIIKFECSCGVIHEKNVRGFLKSSQCKECSKKQRNTTNLVKYGAENILASDYGKEKTKEHYKTKYDKTHNMQVENIRKKAIQTCMLNHNQPFGFFTDESREKAQVTSLDKYGSKCFPISEEGKKQCRDKYGCDYAMQSREVFLKSIGNSYKSKPYKFPSGKIELIQGYEGKCLDRLLYEEHFEEDDIVAGFKNAPSVVFYHNGIKKHYHMDIYIPSRDIGIEVKSYYTYNEDRLINRLKIDAAMKICREFRLYIFIKRHGKIEPYFVIYYVNGVVEKYELDPDFFPDDIDIFKEKCVKLNNVNIIIEEEQQ